MKRKSILLMFGLVTMLTAGVFTGCGSKTDTADISETESTEVIILHDEIETESVLETSDSIQEDETELDVTTVTESTISSLEEMSSETEIETEAEKEAEKESKNQEKGQKTANDSKTAETEMSQTESTETQYKMPDLIGLTQEKAVSILADYDLILNTVTYEYSDSVAGGCVMEQSISADSTVISGSNIAITISKGDEMVTMPDVTGMKAGKARELLTATGFGVKCMIDDNVEVSTQNYAAGDSVKKGTVVTIK